MSMQGRKLTERPSGFTLIELLVVISIIALLVSILLPALSKARKQAQAVICMTNMKQITYACVQYTMENSDYFPVVHDPAELRQYALQASADFPSGLPSPWYFYLWPYHQDFRVYVCPLYPKSVAAVPDGSVYCIWRTDNFKGGAYTAPRSEGDRIYLHSNIGYNNFVGGLPTEYKAKKLTAVPAGLGIFGDSWLPNEPYDNLHTRYFGAGHVMTPGAWTSALDARHNNKVHVGFADSHVEPVSEVYASWESPAEWQNSIWYFKQSGI